MVSQESGGGVDAGSAARPAGDVPKWLVIVAVVVLVAGLATLGVFGAKSLARGFSDDPTAEEIAAERDAVSDVASQVIINAFSFDYNNVDESLEQLASASTGDFLTEQEQWSEDVRSRVVEQKAVTTATVSNTAVEELDLEAGEAAVLVVFTAHSEREGQEDITGRQAMRVDLTRVDDQWKANAVNQVGVTVPVGTSSRSVQELEAPGDGSGNDDTAGEESTTAPAPTTSAGR